MPRALAGGNQGGRVHLLHGIRLEGVREGEAREQPSSHLVVVVDVPGGALTVEGLEVLLEHANAVGMNAELGQLDILPLSILLLELEVAGLSAKPLVCESKCSKPVANHRRVVHGGPERDVLDMLAQVGEDLLGAGVAQAYGLGLVGGDSCDRVAR